MRSGEALGRLLTIKLKDLFEAANSPSLQEILIDDGLKSRLLTDPLITIDITSESTFEIEGNTSDLCISILRDYYLGYLRAKQQWATGKLLSTDITHVAWNVITIYYSAFFCAIEVLRIQGKFPLTLTEQDGHDLFKNATGSYKQDFQSKKHQNFIGSLSTDLSKIIFKANGSKPHDFVWNQLANTTFPALPRKTKDWPELAKFQSICHGEKGWERPNIIRNRWNYRDSTYFSAHGKSVSPVFYKLLVNNRSASEWIQLQSGVRSEIDSIGSLAAIAQFLYTSIDQSYQFGFLGQS